MSTPNPLPAPLEDLDLDELFQSVVVGITGLDGTLVRPRWQANSPTQPEPDTDWCALGVVSSTPNDGPSIVHFGTDDGYDVSTRHEDLEVLVSFYGPNAKRNAGRMRDGIGIPQNMEVLNANSIGFVGCGPIRTIPELVNQQWVRRADMLMQFRRSVSREYAIENLETVDIHLFDDTHVDRLIVEPPETKSE